MWIDHANKHHCLVIEALKASNKEKTKLRQWVEAHVEEIDYLKIEAKIVGESAVLHFIDHFEEHELYDTFTNYWASWNAQAILQCMRKAHPNLDVQL